MDIEDWIAQQREKGRTDEQIRSSMEKAGWDEDTIDSKLNEPDGSTDRATGPGIQDLLPTELDRGRKTIIAGAALIILLAAMFLSMGTTDTPGQDTTTIERGPVAYYSFDDPDRFTIEGAGDSPPLSRNPDTQVVSEGINGSSIQFTGTTPLETRDSLNGEDNSFLSQDGLTISMWVHPFQNTTGTVPTNLFAQGSPDTSRWMQITGGTAGYRAAANFGTDEDPNDEQNPLLVRTSYTLLGGQWNHIAVTFQNDTATIYVNGIKRSQWSEPTGFSGLTTAWRIGGQVGGIGFKGRIDDLRVYDHVLSPDQVQGQYARLEGSVSG